MDRSGVVTIATSRKRIVLLRLNKVFKKHFELVQNTSSQDYRAHLVTGVVYVNVSENHI